MKKLRRPKLLAVGGVNEASASVPQSLTLGCYFCNTMLCWLVFVKAFPYFLLRLDSQSLKRVVLALPLLGAGIHVLPRNLLSRSRISGTLVPLCTFLTNVLSKGAVSGIGEIELLNT